MDLPGCCLAQTQEPYIDLRLIFGKSQLLEFATSSGYIEDL
ncbi:hypothetical protein [Methanosarcina horonobensis]|nr:hypothetical protein [Methanosarcina horonobensis]